MMISDSPAEKHLVMKAIRLMRYDDFETFALVLEWYRAKGRLNSKAKITAAVLRNAIKAVEDGLRLDIKTTKGENK